MQGQAESAGSLNEPYVRWCLVWAPRAAGAAIAVGLAVLVGYALGWQWLYRPLPGGPATHPLTAAALVLIAASALLARPSRTSNASAALALLAGVLALARLFSIAMGREELFQSWSPFGGTLKMAASAGMPITMGLRASIMIALLALALCLIRARLVVYSQIVAIAATYPPLFAAVGYLYGMKELKGVFSGTTLCMAVLCIGAVLGRTAHRVPLRSLMAFGEAGRDIRHQIILLVGVCLALGLVATRSGFDTQAGTLAVEASVIVIVIVLVLLNVAYRSERSALRRQGTALGNLPLLLELEGAAERGELFLAFQPQVNLADEKVIGVEVLIRWHHPTRGMISPAEFIPLAESSPLINSLGAWVLDEACRHAADWRDGILAGVAVSVNVSPIQLKEPGFVAMVERIQRSQRLEPGRLILEITESAMVQDNDPGFRTLAELRQRGVRIAIDDFGTGYSSLSYLRDLPSDYLKIDQSFVRDLPGKPEAEAIARAIVAVGKSLGYQIVAEGVETREQAEFLQSIWCDKGQGYLYAGPMRAEELKVWAQNRERAAHPALASTSGVASG